jgi:hypothetical protein
MSLPRSLENLLSSITSQKLQKITLTFTDLVRDDDSGEDLDIPDFEGDDDGDEWNEGTAAWDPLGTTLIRLAQQVHKVEGKLTLQLVVRPGPFHFGHLVPKFLENSGLVDIEYEGRPTSTL